MQGDRGGGQAAERDYPAERTVQSGAARLLHASCAARDGAGVLLVGPPGSGKSDLLLRLLDRGFALVADDQVLLEGGVARPPDNLAGLLEIRGLGVLRLPHERQASLFLVVVLERRTRMPDQERYPELDVPVVYVDPQAASAPQIVSLALDAVQGKYSLVAGAFA